MILFNGIACRKYLDSFSFLMWKIEDDATELSCWHWWESLCLYSPCSLRFKKF